MPLSFSTPISVTTGSQSLPTIADLNGDRYADLITILNSNTTSSISINLGNGNGTFGAANPIAISPASSTQKVVSIDQMVVGDFNGDGKQDLWAIAGITATVIPPFPGFPTVTQSIVVLPGNGNGTFGTPVFTALANANQRLSSAIAKDFNGDGKLDVVAIASIYSFSQQTEQLVILSGDGTGKFSAPTALTVEGTPTQVATGDFNGDGLPDLVVNGNTRTGYYSSRDTLSVLLSTGNGSFSTASKTSGSGEFTVADFNGDGKADILTGNTVLLGDGTGQLQAKPLPNFSYGIPADFNGDGQLDLATAGTLGDYYRNGRAAATVLLGNGQGNWNRKGASFVVDNSNAGLGVKLAVADFNGDGKPDVLATPGKYSSRENLTVLLNTTVGTDAIALSQDKSIDASIISDPINVNLAQRRLVIQGVVPLSQQVNNYLNVVGSAKNDIIIGSRQANDLQGFDGNDRISGLAGDDLLTGGNGKDVLIGGAGKDSFVFDTGQPFKRSMGIDVIKDFTRGQDVIVLDRSTFTKLLSKVGFVTVESIAQAQRSAVGITYIAETGALYYNQNGSAKGFGTGGQFADLPNGLALTVKDFKIIS